MLETLIIIAGLIWLPLVMQQMASRGLLVLVIWLCVGPLASNLVANPGKNPLFPDATFSDDYQDEPNLLKRREGYFLQEETIRVKELLEPTRIFFGLFLLTFLGRSVIRDRRVITLDNTERWMLVFSLLVLASAIFFSRRLAYNVRIAVDAFIIPFLAYFTARRLVPDEERLNQFIRAMTYFGCFLIVICVIERLMHPELLHRVQGPFKTRDYLYVFMIVVFFIVLMDAFVRGRKRQSSILSRGIHAFVLIGSPIVIVLTLTRGNWVGFLTGLWTFGLLSRQLLVRRQKLALAGLIIGLVPIVLIGTRELLQTSLIGERVTRISTIETRLRTYALVVEAGRDNPLFGIGLNNLRDYLMRRSYEVDDKILGTPHNSYLAIFAELGIFALVVYLGIMWSIYRTAFRIFRIRGDVRARWRGMGTVAMLTAYLVPGLFTHLVYGQLFAHIYLFACLGAIVGRYGSPQFRAALVPVPVRMKESLLQSS